MKKKAYLKPSATVEQVELMAVLATSNVITNTGGNGGIGYGGGGSGPAHAPQFDDLWDDDDDVEIVEANSMDDVSGFIRQSKLYNAWED